MLERPEKKGLSRRDFLRGVAVTAIAYAFPNIAFEKFARAIGVTEQMTPAEGFATLKHAVFNAPTEQAAWLVTTRHNVTWRHLRDMDVNKGEIPDEVGRALANEPLLEDVERVHTHPIAALETLDGVPKDYREQLKKGEVKPALAPPSMDDLYAHAATARHFVARNIPFRDTTMDTSGTWRMTIDKEGDFFKKVRTLAIIGQETFPKALADSNLPQAEQKRIEECVTSGGNIYCITSDMPKKLQTALYQLTDAQENLHSAWGAQGIAYAHTVKQTTIESIHQSETERKHANAQVIKLAQVFGIYLTFEPYEEETNH